MAKKKRKIKKEKSSAKQKNIFPVLQYVNQSRLCPEFAAEYGTKQVILNQPSHQSAVDPSSRMPNKNLNSMPELCSHHSSLTSKIGTDGTSDSEDLQKAPISQQ